jgi:uncharacterized protein YggT (Ycf19 family)
MSSVQPDKHGLDPTPVSTTARVSQLIYLIFGILEALIGLRVVLKLLAANGDAGIVSLIYTVTAPFLALFQGIFPTPQGSGHVLELSSLVALIVYALLGYAIARLVEILGRRNATGTP